MYQIRKIRKRLRVTQTTLSSKAGISQPYLCDLEHNRRGAKPETLEKIADALGVKVEELTDQEAG